MTTQMHAKNGKNEIKCKNEGIGTGLVDQVSAFLPIKVATPHFETSEDF